MTARLKWLPSIFVAIAVVTCNQNPDEPRTFTLSLPSGSVDTESRVSAEIVRRQRALFHGLSRSHIPDSLLTIPDFDVRTHKILSDPPRRGLIREGSFAQYIGVRAPVDTLAIREAGDLLNFTSFEVLQLGSRQVMVLASTEDLSRIVATNWGLDRSTWRAFAMYIQPDTVFVRRVRDAAHKYRSSSKSERERR